jgi:hypothetical protein
VHYVFDLDEGLAMEADVEESGEDHVNNAQSVDQYRYTRDASDTSALAISDVACWQRCDERSCESGCDASGGDTRQPGGVIIIIIVGGHGGSSGG